MDVLLDSASDTFKIGDVVRLKSGGPEMTISEKLDAVNGEVFSCVWFDNAFAYHNNVFYPHMLKLIS